MMSFSNNLVLGIDFGSDSGRCALIDTATGKELAFSMMAYPRWAKGLYCNPGKSQFRQHPLDYLEVLEFIVNDTLKKAPGANNLVKAMSIAMTGSTPVAVDKEGVPLSLKPAFTNYPNAMFILWKDHTGQKENEEINWFSCSQESDYTRSRLCGNYSVEHFWTKALHVFKDNAIRDAAYSFVEASDWLPGELTGNTKPEELKRGKGIATSRVLWNRAWGGYPPDSFFRDLNPVLGGIIKTFDPQTYTCNQVVGTLDNRWAEKLNLSHEVIVSVGNLDCHAGAIGAGVRAHTMIEIIGTSTVAITVGADDEKDAMIPGVPQQAFGMIVPDKMGYEGGQSGFGDLYAWFKNILMWSVNHVLERTSLIEEKTKEKLITEAMESLIPLLTEHAEAVPYDNSHVIATDWINGRRSPNADFDLKGTIAGLELSTTAPLIYKSLVEATAYGAKSFIEQFQNNGGRLDEIIAVGGISHKSPFIMQVLADVIGIPVKILSTQEACSHGSAMCAAVAADIYPTLQDAQKYMGSKLATIYEPNAEKKEYYLNQYRKYLGLSKIKEIIA